MRVVNQQLAAAKTYLRTDIQSAITQAIHESNSLQQMRSALIYVASGSVVGADNRLLQDCDNALQAISQSITQLNKCLLFVDQLDEMEEHDD